MKRITEKNKTNKPKNKNKSKNEKRTEGATRNGRGSERHETKEEKGGSCSPRQDLVLTGCWE